MEYEIRRVVEEIDVIALNEEEYSKINNFYKEIISKRFPRLQELDQIYDIQRMILTDGLSRVEVLISANGKLPSKDPGFHRPIPDDIAPTRTVTPIS